MMRTVRSMRSLLKPCPPAFVRTGPGPRGERRALSEAPICAPAEPTLRVRKIGVEPRFVSPAPLARGRCALPPVGFKALCVRRNSRAQVPRDTSCSWDQKLE